MDVGCGRHTTHWTSKPGSEIPFRVWNIPPVASPFSNGLWRRRTMNMPRSDGKHVEAIRYRSDRVLGPLSRRRPPIVGAALPAPPPGMLPISNGSSKSSSKPAFPDASIAQAHDLPPQWLPTSWSVERDQRWKNAAAGIQPQPSSGSGGTHDRGPGHSKQLTVGLGSVADFAGRDTFAARLCSYSAWRCPEAAITRR